MNRKHPRCSLLTLCILLVMSALFPGCDSGTGSVGGERALVRVGESIVTVRDFYEEFESGIMAPSVLYSDPEALRDEKYRALVRLAEELIIMERARELEITVSDEEVAQAVSDFKQDFPDDTFETTLLENGISYLLWEKGLRRRLLMEKVIRKDVSEDSFQVPLPPKPKDESDAAIPEVNLLETDAQDMETSSGEASQKAGETDTADSQVVPDVADTVTDLTTTLPVNVGEAEYSAWIKRLKNQYTIEIDWELWEKIEKEDSEL